MENNKETEFTGLRAAVFPIHKYELKKFIPLTLLFFCIGYNYSVLRTTKDVFVMANAGADSIYFLKTMGVTPAIFLFTIIYSYVNRSMGRDGRFNVVIIYFISFFIIYLFIFLPNAESLKLNSFADSMNLKIPRFKGLWEVIRSWHISLYYIHSDAWGTYALQVCFWTFANDVINLKQAKRFYGILIAIGANVGAIAAGQSLKFIFKGDPHITISFIIVVGIIAIVIYNYFSRAIKANPKDYQIEEKKKKKKKVKLPLSKSLTLLFRSKYLALIAIIVLGYNISIALFEAVWKDRMKVYSLGDSAILSDLYGNQLTFIGISTILFLFILGPWVRKSAWTINAIITPLVFFIASCLFFFFMFFGDTIVNLFPGKNVDTLFYAVIIGLINVVFIKAAKYAFFDTSKEMAYIPLDEESKVNGKAAVDAIGSRLGKSMGSFLVAFVFIQLTDGTIGGSKHYIAGAIMIVIAIWLAAVLKLGVLFKNITSKDNSKKEDDSKK